jgi:hypothetical protein
MGSPHSPLGGPGARVKVIDIALEYANDNYEADVCWGLGGSARQSIKLQRPRSDKPTSTTARRSSPSAG